ncbi:MAG: hypothetical protein ACOCT0_03265 [Halobacteriota archaeon]
MIKRVIEAALGRFLLGVGLLAVVVPVALALSVGTDTLTALGLDRDTAGTIVTAVVVIAVVAGLAAFARYGIDWD